MQIEDPQESSPVSQPAGSVQDTSDSVSTLSSPSSITPHYDDRNDVILRVECIGDSTTKFLTAVMQLVTLVGIGLLVACIILISSKSEGFFFRTESLYAFNTAVASAQLCVLLPHCTYFGINLVKALRSKKRWSRRRWRSVRLSICESLVQVINSVFFLIPNARENAIGCTWFDSSTGWLAFVRLSCWNTLFLIFIIAASNMVPAKGRYFQKFLVHNRSDPILLDAYLLVHWPHFLLWLGLEGLLLATTILEINFPPVQRDIVLAAGQSCLQYDYVCHFTKATEILSYSMVIMPVSYGFLYCKFTLFCKKCLSFVTMMILTIGAVGRLKDVVSVAAGKRRYCVALSYIHLLIHASSNLNCSQSSTSSGCSESSAHFHTISSGWEISSSDCRLVSGPSPLFSIY